MREFIKRIAHGCKDHPGTFPLIALCLLGGMAGGLFGLGLSVAIYLPCYLIGAYYKEQ